MHADWQLICSPVPPTVTFECAQPMDGLTYLSSPQCGELGAGEFGLEKGMFRLLLICFNGDM